MPSETSATARYYRSRDDAHANSGQFSGRSGGIHEGQRLDAVWANLTQRLYTSHAGVVYISGSTFGDAEDFAAPLDAEEQLRVPHTKTIAANIRAKTLISQPPLLI